MKRSLGALFFLLAVGPAATAYEGFGSVTRGADDCPSGPMTYTVTSLANSGAGTLRDAVSQNCRHIVFSVGGTIALTSDLLIQRSYLTIDGSTAPAPGITVSVPDLRIALEASNSLGPIHDVIVHHLRFQGTGTPMEGNDLMEMDGSINPISRVVLDHNTLSGSGDGNYDVYGTVSDVTVSWNIITAAVQGQHFSLETPPNRERISFHHNLYARLNERQTRARYDNLQVDFVNNVIYGWGWIESGGRGMALPTDPGYHATINVEDNYYHFVPGLPGGGDGDDALEFDSANYPGSVYFDGNVFPAAENDDISTSPRIPIPAYAEVTHFGANTLGNTVVPCVGTKLPTVQETALLQQISLAIGGSGGACTSGGPALSLSDVTVLEGDVGTTLATVAVSVSPLATVPVVVGWATANGTATSPGDYVAASGSLTIAAGGLGSIAVAVNGDTALEPSETFSVNLSGPLGATIADGQGVVTIANDESVPEASPGLILRLDLAAASGAPATDYLSLLQQPRSSYEVVLDEASGDLVPGLRLDRVGPALSTVVQASVPVSGVGAARSLRWQNTGATSVSSQFLRVSAGACGSACGPDDRYRLRVYETSYRVPRFNNAGGQATVLIVQNASTDTAPGTVWFWSGAGALLGSTTFNLQPRQTSIIPLASLAGLAGQSGSITITHGGRYGSLAGKAVSLEASTGFSFDTPMEPWHP
jgi:pectate lyase